MRIKRKKSQEGFALIITLLGLALMSILGIAIIGITTSNARMTKIDSQSQGTYYIAEAGVSQAVYEISGKVKEFSDQTLSHDEFFGKLGQYIDGHLKNTSVAFEPNIGKSSSATIDVGDGTLIKEEILGNYSERIVNYVINSKGKIGDLNRAVGTSVNISHKIKIGSAHHPAFDYAIYSGGNKEYANAGNATIKGSIYGHDLKFDATNTNIEGMIISEKSVDLISAVKLKGNVYAMDGKVNLLNSNIEMKGDIHATDHVTLSHGTSVDGAIYTNNDVILKSSSVKVTGSIHSGGHVSLGSTSTVEGSIYTNKDVVFLSSGAKIIGNINAAGNVGRSTEGTSVTVHGNIVSGGNVITRANQSYKIFGNVHGAGNITNGSGNEISGHVVSGKSVINNGTIKERITENATATVLESPIRPSSPDFETYKQIDNDIPLTNFNIEEGDEEIVADVNSTQHIIIPGSYKDLTLKWNDTVKFTSGSYYFNEIKGSPAAIKLQLDLSNGPINIYTKGNVKFGSGLEISVSEDGANYKKIKDIYNSNPDLAIELAGKVYWETHNNFQLPETCYFLGTILADNNFTTSSSPTLIGAYAVNKGEIKMGYNPTILYAPPTDSSTGGSGGGGAGSHKGRNTTPEEEWIKTKDPMREQ